MRSKRDSQDLVSAGLAAAVEHWEERARKAEARMAELEGELAKALALVNAARFCDFAVRSKHAEKLAAWADKCGGTGIIYALPDQSGEVESDGST